MEQNVIDKVEQENLKALVKVVSQIGIESSLDEPISEGMRSGRDAFDVSAFQKIDSDNVAIDLHFTKDEDRKYAMNNYGLTLYDVVDLGELRKSIPILDDLERRMRDTDWYFDLAENIASWTKGYRDVCKMEDELRLLSHSPEGEKAAVYLWNNIVPPVSTSKPDFLYKIERRLELYAQKDFATCISLLDSFPQVKDYRTFDNYLSRFSIPEFEDKSIKLGIINGLVNGNREMITLEKSIIPAANTESYVVIEHFYPKGMIYEQGHEYREINRFDKYNDAITCLNVNASVCGSANSILKLPEIVVIGQYRNKKLEYDYECCPLLNTGYIVATAYPKVHNDSNGKYEIKFNNNFHEGGTLGELLFVEKDFFSGGLRFYDALENVKSIDEDFWAKEKGKRNGQVGYEIGKEISKAPLAKNVDGKDLGHDCLLPKNRISTDRGQSIR